MVLGQILIFDHQLLRGDLLRRCEGKNKTVQDRLFRPFQLLGGNGFLTDLPEDLLDPGDHLDGGRGFRQCIRTEQTIFPLRVVETARAVGQTQIGPNFLKNPGTESSAPDNKVQNLKRIELGIPFGRRQPAENGDRLWYILGQEINSTVLLPGKGRGFRFSFRPPGPHPVAVVRQPGAATSAFLHELGSPGLGR